MTFCVSLANRTSWPYSLYEMARRTGAAGIKFDRLRVGNLARRVVLLIESSRKVGRDVLSGIASYATPLTCDSGGPWHFCHYERSLEDPPPRWLRQWKPDGIIARIENRRVLRRLAKLGAPTIDVIYSLQPPVEGTVRVVLDQRAIAVTAADHLRGQGFEQFAFCGYPGILWSDIRQRQFVEHLRESGRSVFEYQKPSQGTRAAGRRRTFETRAELDELWHTEELMRWIRSLPRPIGIMACNDVPRPADPHRLPRSRNRRARPNRRTRRRQ